MSRKPATSTKRFGPKGDFEIPDTEYARISSHLDEITMHSCIDSEVPAAHFLLMELTSSIQLAVRRARVKLHAERQKYALANPYASYSNEALLEQWRTMRGVHEYSDHIDNAAAKGIDPKAGPAKRKLRTEMERRGMTFTG